MNRRKYTKDILEEAVRTSFSMREALRKCGAPNLAGGLHSHISKLVREYGISTAHFLGKRSNLGSGEYAKKKSAEEILVYHADNQRQRSKSLMRALLEIGREYKCSVCGLRDWQGKRIVLEVDHKDADFQNDESSNLAFICPNCHSQTPSFCRGKRPPKQPKRLQNEVGRRKSGTKGRKPRHPSMDGYWRTRDKPEARKVQWPTPGELQSLVQSMSMVKIGEQFGVSDNAVRKWAKRYGMDIGKKKGTAVVKETNPKLIRTIVDGKTWCYIHKDYVPIDNFTKDKNDKLGLHGCCRDCRKTEPGRGKKRKVLPV